MNSNRFFSYVSSTVIFILFLAAPAANADGNSFDFNVYGQVKLDSIYDSASMNNGDSVTGVNPTPSNGANTSEFIMTANQSRVGVNITAPSALNASVSGKIEMDFYNPNTQIDYRPAPMLRLAYVKLDWKESKFSLIAGQAWDLLDPFYGPNTLDYAINWRAGNVGYRRPQIHVIKGFDMGGGLLNGEFALTRASSDSGLTPSVSNNDSGAPGLQARVSYAKSFWMDEPLQVGISASKSNPKVFSGVTAGAPTDSGLYYTANQWSVGADLKVPIIHRLTFSGIIYRGSDMWNLLGLSKAIYASSISQMEHGGWAQLSYQILDDLTATAGYSFSELEGPQGATGTAITKNDLPWIEVVYKLSAQVSTGFMAEEFTSHFANGDHASAERYMVSMMLGF